MPQFEPMSVTVSDDGFGIVQSGDFEPIVNKDGLASYAGGLVITDSITNSPDVTVTGPPTVTALQSSYTISLHRPSKTSRISKVRVKLVVPVELLDVNGDPTGIKSHENSADTTYLFSEKSTEDERIALDTMFRALTGDAPSSLVIQQLKSVY